MTQEQLEMQSRDMDSLMRNQQLYDSRRVWIMTERVVYEMAVTKSDFEQLRNKAVKLRTEKKI